jgi:hypothetical protein
VSDAIAESKPAIARHPRWSAMLRLGLEFALLFGGTLLVQQILLISASGSFPNLLWLPVLALSLQHGFATGFAAAIVAAVLQFSGGLPPALISEDVYSYSQRIAAEPVGWTCVALLIGHIRSRQIARTAELEAELAERSRQCVAVADLCVDLRRRTAMLERHIAANAFSSNADVAEAISDLNQAGWEDFSKRLTRFIVLMTGASQFSVYVLSDDGLKMAFRPSDGYRPGVDVSISRDDPLFAAVVSERRILSAGRPGEDAVLARRGVVAGPVLESKTSDRVIGMFAIGGAPLEDHPDDIERRFVLTCWEISRLIGRITLIDSWQAALPTHANGGRAPHQELAGRAWPTDQASVPVPRQAEPAQRPRLQ